MTDDLPLNLCSYGSEILFFHGAFIFEDVGVTAYHGAVPLVSAALASVSTSGISVTKLLKVVYLINR